MTNDDIGKSIDEMERILEESFEASGVGKVRRAEILAQMEAEQAADELDAVQRRAMTAELELLTRATENMEAVEKSSLGDDDTAWGLRFVQRDTQKDIELARARVIKSGDSALLERFERVVSALDTKLEMFVASLEKFEGLGKEPRKEVIQ